MPVCCAFAGVLDLCGATMAWLMMQTMLRIKEPSRSLDFYTRVLGMTLLAKLDFPSMSFTLYFLGYEKTEDIPEDPAERVSVLSGFTTQCS